MAFFPVRPGRLALVLSALSVPFLAAATPRLSADAAVERALSSDLWQEEWQAGVDVARGELQSARTLSNPTLALGREDLREAGLASGDETTLMLVQPFELGGRRGAQIRAAEAGISVAEAQAVRDRQRIRAATLQAYYRAVAAEQVHAVRRATFADLEALADVAQKRQTEGDLSGYEARRIRHAAEQARTAQADAEASAQAARAALSLAAGSAAADAALDDAIPLPSLVAGDAPGSADLDVLAAERAQADAEWQAARAISLPISVGLGRKRTRVAGFSDDVLMLEVGVDLPLFDRRQGERERARAALSLAEARHEREQAQLEARRAALLAQATVHIASAERIATRLLPEATQLRAIAQASFSEGELDLVALLDAYDTHADLAAQGLDQRVLAVEAALAYEALSPTAVP